MERNRITGTMMADHESMEYNNFTGQRIKKSENQNRWPSFTGNETEPVSKSSDEKKWPSFSGDSEEDDNEFEKNIPIFKADDDEHIVCGIVYEPDTEDAQGDKANEIEIRKAAYSFMESNRVFKINHNSKVGIRILESYIAPADFTVSDKIVKKGSWVLSLRVLSKAVWKKIKDGSLTGFSMAGTAERSNE